MQVELQLPVCLFYFCALGLIRSYTVPPCVLIPKKFWGAAEADTYLHYFCIYKIHTYVYSFSCFS